MTQNITENQAHCKSIADRLELVAEGRLYICPECGEFFDCNETEEGPEYTTICPECDKELDTNALEQMTMFDYFNDCYNIEYRIDANGEYKSVELMVACGGPNIYVDTKTATVNLYWWGDSASWDFSRDTANAIDEAFEELWACR